MLTYAVLVRKAFQFLGFLLLIILADQLLHHLIRANGLSYAASATAVLIPLIGEIYAVLLAFMIFVIWTQFTDVENCVIREANSLNELLRYTALLTDDLRSSVRRLVSSYVRGVLEQEWPELADGRKDLQTEEAFAKLVQVVVASAAANPHLLEALRNTSRNRDERVAKSLTRMPPTLSGLIQLIALVLWCLIYLYSFQNTAFGPLCYSVAALILFIANFVMTDTDNPLKGLWNVRSSAFSDLHR